jgi:sugar phosphate isomerase/epimerase
MKSESPPNLDLLAINAITVRDKWNLRQTVEGCARQGIRGISTWRDKVAETGVKQAARMIRDNGLTVTGLCSGGRFPAADRNGRKAALDDNRRAIDEAATLEARCLIIVAGGLPAGSRDLAGAREMVIEGLGDVLEHARAAGVPLAIEPLHPMFCADRACINTLAQALDVCDVLAGPQGTGIGVAVDVYHVWWDPQLKDQIERATEKRLLAFHICDWLVPTSEMLTDRGMMGDGVIDIPLIRSWMEDAGYRGFHEVEIMSSRNWWLRDPVEVLAICRERHQTAC